MPRKRIRGETVFINVKLEDTHDDEEYGIQPGSSSISMNPPRRREDLQLMDSLSKFYTPITGRRSSKPIIKLDGGTIGTSDEEDDKTQVRRKIDAMKKKSQQPLSVDVNLTAMDVSAEGSPSKSHKTLTDSLSPYFSASKEKRRTVKRGEFLSLSGVRQKAAAVAGDQSEGGATTDSTVSPIVVMPERRKNAAGIGQVVGRRRTQNSASAALFSSPEKEANEDDLANRQKRPRTPKQLFSPKAERRISGSAQPSTSRVENSPLSSDEEIIKDKKKSRRKKSEKLGNKKDGSMISGGIDDKENIVDDGSITISTEQRDMFETIRQKVSDEIDLGESTSGQYQERVDKEPRLPRQIRLGRHLIKTWYSSPFPMEYIHVPVLYMCDFCLKYVKTENMMINHLNKCKLFHPPGAEIYRKDNVSVFEVDGNLAKSYCQNLCLLSKAFLDHKTLFYDVEPFLFYVVTKNDADGFHFVGYFSKEKYSQHTFNLSCIVTVPCYQKLGFGRFLIDFSFLLSRTEKIAGTPEKPLSDLGRISYASYWRTALLEWVHKNNLTKEKNCEFSIDDISLATGISKFDIVEVFDSLGWLRMDEEGEYGLFIDYDLVNAHWEKAKNDKNRIWLDEKKLKWTPNFFSPSKDNFRSPLRSPMTPKKTPTSASATKTSTPSGVSLAAFGSTMKSGVSTRRRAPVGRNLKQQLYEEDKVKTILDDSTNSDEESYDDAKKIRNRRKTWSCKETSIRKARRRDDTPEDDTPKRGRRDGPATAASNKKANNSESAGRRATLPTGSSSNGGSGSARRRGKMIFEDSSDEESSSPARSDSSDDDVTYSGKPANGKIHRPAMKNPRKKPPQKGNKSAAKMSPKQNDSPVCDSKNDPVIESASEAGVEMESKNVAEAEVVDLNGVSRENDQEEDKDATLVAMSAPGPSTTTSGESENESGESDDEKKMDVPIATRYERSTPCSTTTDNSAISSRTVTPRPRGDRPVEDDMINMGFVPDYDDPSSRFGELCEDNDGPPPLDIERMCQPMPNLDDDAPPMLTSTALSETQGMLTLNVSNDPDGYSTGEDDAPPQLSPNFGKTEQDELSEKEKILEAMDRPPMAPVAAGMEIDEEEKLYHQQLSANAQNGIGSVGPPGSNQMMMQQQQMPSSSCQNMMTSTPQHPYSQGPGSMQQATPGSGGVPSCSQMYNHSTPEQQQQQQQQNSQAFMSPSMQMPSSVSSVHSVHNTSMEMVAGPSQPSQQQQSQPQPQNQYVPVPEMMQNMPSTSTAQQEAMHMQARMQQFGSPPTSQQQQQVAQQAQPVQQRSNGRSTEGSSSRKHRQQQQQAQQQAQQQQLQQQHQLQQQQQQHMQQMQQHMNQMQFHGYPPGYAGYHYPQFDAFNYSQYWQNGMFPQYYAPTRMPAAGAAANQAWPGYPNVSGAQGAAANVPPNQFPPNPAAPFAGFPPDLYQNFYMKNG